MSNRLQEVKDYWETYGDHISVERPRLGERVDWLIAELERAERAMVTEVEVWPLAADPTGIWLLEPTGPWPSEPIMDDREPHDLAVLELQRHRVWNPDMPLHATSWRIEHDPVSGRNYQRDSYMAVIACDGLVPASWPDALPVTALFAEEVGPAPAHGVAEAPPVPWSHVLLHGLRTLRGEMDTNVNTHKALSKLWRRHLLKFKPAFARMYSLLHEAV